MKKLAFIMFCAVCAVSVGAIDPSDVIAPSPAETPVNPDDVMLRRPEGRSRADLEARAAAAAAKAEAEAKAKAEAEAAAAKAKAKAEAEAKAKAEAEAVAKAEAEAKSEKKKTEAKAKSDVDVTEMVITSERTDIDPTEGIILFDRNVVVTNSQYQIHADRLFVFLDSTNNLMNAKFKAKAKRNDPNNPKTKTKHNDPSGPKAKTKRNDTNPKFKRIVAIGNVEINVSTTNENSNVSTTNEGRNVSTTNESVEVSCSRAVVTFLNPTDGTDSELLKIVLYGDETKNVRVKGASPKLNDSALEGKKITIVLNKTTRELLQMSVEGSSAVNLSGEMLKGQDLKNLREHGK